QLLDPAVKAPVPFIDNYFSDFGDNYRNFTLNDPDQNLNNISLGNIIDVSLDPYPYHNTASGIALQHSYAAAWYAGSATAPGYTTNPKVGLIWSPLLSNPGTSFNSEQSWRLWNFKQGNQFDLEAQSAPSARVPDFEPLPLTHTGDTGDVTFTNSSVTLS